MPAHAVNLRHPEASPLSSFHLHARLFEGSLAAPVRNEVQSGESDELSEITELAQTLSNIGFSVWIYEHNNALEKFNESDSDYKVIAEWKPGGVRVS